MGKIIALETVEEKERIQHTIARMLIDNEDGGYLHSEIVDSLRAQGFKEGAVNKALSEMKDNKPLQNSGYVFITVFDKEGRENFYYLSARPKSEPMNLMSTRVT